MSGRSTLDHDLRASGKARGMHLRDGGGGERGLIEGAEHLRTAPDRRRARSTPRADGPWKRRHAILQLGELVGDIRRQQVGGAWRPPWPNFTKMGPSSSSASRRRSARLTTRNRSDHTPGERQEQEGSGDR